MKLNVNFFLDDSNFDTYTIQSCYINRNFEIISQDIIIEMF